MNGTPADAYLALRAIKAGIDAALAELEKEVGQVRAVYGSKSFDSPLGTLVWTNPPVPALTFDPDALLEWARVNMPHEVIEERSEIIPEHHVFHPAEVRSTLPKTLQKRFKARDGVVVDGDTGEVVDWAHQPEQTRTGHWTTKLTPEAKDDAAAAILARLDTLTGILQVEQ